MLTKLLLSISKLPAWLGRAKRENPWLFAEFWALVVMLAGIVLNLFSFRSDDVSMIFLIVIPGLWILFQPFFLAAVRKRKEPFGASAAATLPLWTMTVGDAAGMLAIAVGHDAFGSFAYDVFYLLVLATTLRIPFIVFAGRAPYRGKPWVDQGLLIVSYALSVILYSLSVTL
ncbi:MAG TPA: hypothetical protein DCR44_02440 [Acholeplasmatales bacterium]|nr:MAG: hypothetical protein A2Y16_07230 [Tenericutes bacterium GWF2_57_13]HAQ56251.1 hypothetical protein [Acholeplasmatales bacterium]